MRYSAASVSTFAFALLFGAASALPQGPIASEGCVAGSGLYKATAAATAVCTPCASINREAGTATGTCGACNVANSALDATTGACLCAGTDKGRIDGKCLPCGVNGFANGNNRITCSPCRVGAAPDSTGACRCNSDKGLIGDKCVMCVSIGRKNGPRSTSLTSYGDCGLCLDATKMVDAAGNCVVPCPAGSGYVNGACAVCSVLERGATGDGLTCSGCTVTTATPNPTTGACPAPIVPCDADSGYVNGAYASCAGLYRRATGDGLTCSRCIFTLTGPNPTTGACPARTPIDTPLLDNRSFENRVGNQAVSWIRTVDPRESSVYFSTQYTPGSRAGNYAYAFNGEYPASICQDVTLSEPGMGSMWFFAAVTGEENIPAIRQGSLKAVLRLGGPTGTIIFSTPEMKDTVPFTAAGTYNYRGYSGYNPVVPAGDITVCMEGYNPSANPYLVEEFAFQLFQYG